MADGIEKDPGSPERRHHNANDARYLIDELARREYSIRLAKLIDAIKNELFTYDALVDGRAWATYTHMGDPNLADPHQSPVQHTILLFKDNAYGDGKPHICLITREDVRYYLNVVSVKTELCIGDNQAFHTVTAEQKPVVNCPEDNSPSYYDIDGVLNVYETTHVPHSNALALQNGAESMYPFGVSDAAISMLQTVTAMSELFEKLRPIDPDKCSMQGS
jgi:hypothetical protein